MGWYATKVLDGMKGLQYFKKPRTTKSYQPGESSRLVKPLSLVKGVITTPKSPLGHIIKASRGAPLESPDEAADESPDEAADESPDEAADESPDEAPDEPESPVESPVEAPIEAPVKALDKPEFPVEAPIEAPVEAPVKALNEATNVESLMNARATNVESLMNARETFYSTVGEREGFILGEWRKKILREATYMATHPSYINKSVANYGFEQQFFHWGASLLPMWTPPSTSNIINGWVLSKGDLFMFYNNIEGLIELFGIAAVSPSNQERRGHWEVTLNAKGIPNKQGVLYLTPKIGEIDIDTYKEAAGVPQFTGFGLNPQSSTVMIKINDRGGDRLRECLLQAETDPSHWMASDKTPNKDAVLYSHNTTKWYLTEGMIRCILSRLTGEPFCSVRPGWLRGLKGRNYELDGFSELLQLAFEYNGIQHAMYVKFFHGPVKKGGMEKFALQQERDRYKSKLCAARGVHLMVFRHDELWPHMRFADFQEIVEWRLSAAFEEQKNANALTVEA